MNEHSHLCVCDALPEDECPCLHCELVETRDTLPAPPMEMAEEGAAA